ncbi:YbaB/EbfC family nucleoid-associated protein [Gordonia liuliyuniae]|uniref:YbaB/EbfC family nucleoid-associated protein n=1 Tax=Gordonia liuliyuniae TaxID=2911517 RepID=A0ABS9INC2_9ACTN|nr:YbaB/EbfC family nucleoid-associated protein [Gordonia liuliyuniae]MCF8587044.1 YbaB/EbfC family nucleoid-associated protein [Gordonia liuliyuniae]
MSVMDEVQRTAERQLDMLEDVQRKLNALTVQETGDDGRVIVQVDVSGAMTGLQLVPGAGNGRPAALADAIVRTAVRAATQAFAERAEIMSEFVAEFADLTGESVEPNSPSLRPTFREPETEGES